ncbi:MAG TPA: helix-turn-helix transcriptional regulator, partial [Longimicrobiales bacterium]
VESNQRDLPWKCYPANASVKQNRSFAGGRTVMQDDDRAMRAVLFAGMLLILIGGIVDLYLDRPEHWLTLHVVFELIMIAGALIFMTAFWLGWWRSRGEAARLRQSLEQRRVERDAWKANAEKSLEGLGVAIERQFQQWRLTPAESDVALLLLKGYSHKHIAADTGRSERTVRQHATTVYGKAGLASRAELAAFFLDALRLPVRTGH